MTNRIEVAPLGYNRAGYRCKVWVDGEIDRQAVLCNEADMEFIIRDWVTFYEATTGQSMPIEMVS